jgi:hypothetical protein
MLFWYKADIIIISSHITYSLHDMAEKLLALLLLHIHYVILYDFKYGRSTSLKKKFFARFFVW